MAGADRGGFRGRHRLFHPAGEPVTARAAAGGVPFMSFFDSTDRGAHEIRPASSSWSTDGSARGSIGLPDSSKIRCKTGFPE
ncbi:hypothetical protein [Pseudosporangium ferrugineum]|uniref:hypothetical protein n=1 Tax=Pseudosporangium ferrugineum TaxID=439699 RepID=UPI001304BF3B|nr:hypothetical protein [Pseudosporangium ferrugineum]